MDGIGKDGVAWHIREKKQHEEIAGYWEGLAGLGKDADSRAVSM